MGILATQNAFADALLHADQPVPDGITTARGGADAVRFAVYRNNVFVGLTRALAQQFPVTERLVGTEFFMAMARVYAQDHKPVSPLIFEYGHDFPDFIAKFHPAQALVYLSDVARLDAAWMRAYHAADATPLGVTALAAVAPGALPGLRLVPHPSAEVVQSLHPIGSIWSAHQRDMVTPVNAWHPEAVLVVRPAMTVNVHILPAQDATFATSLFKGATLGEAADAALAADPAFDFGTALIGLAGLGSFGTLKQHEGNVP